ncbi:hypothetical protein EAG_03722 [Camponotus floridanus]|uniref:Uncharacterized protein n=1 Tax=Camponotus floridanus TaxID=104421 RepID=E2A8W9_CAMFO|nr:hypothetical protein EAG_03722 [Camponotus floridanus]
MGFASSMSRLETVCRDDLGNLAGCCTLDRAVTTLRSVETQPSAWGIVLSVRRDPTRHARASSYFRKKERKCVEKRKRERQISLIRSWWIRKAQALRAGLYKRAAAPFEGAADGIRDIDLSGALSDAGVKDSEWP